MSIWKDNTATRQPSVPSLEPKEPPRDDAPVRPEPTPAPAPAPVARADTGPIRKESLLSLIHI